MHERLLALGGSLRPGTLVSNFPTHRQLPACPHPYLSLLKAELHGGSRSQSNPGGKDEISRLRTQLEQARAQSKDMVVKNMLLTTTLNEARCRAHDAVI